MLNNSFYPQRTHETANITSELLSVKSTCPEP